MFQRFGLTKRGSLYLAPDPPGGVSDDWTPPQGEEWRKELPKDFREKPVPELAKEFVRLNSHVGQLNNDYGTFKQSAAQKEQQYQSQLADHNKYVDAVRQWQEWHQKEVQPHWDAYQQWRQQQAQGGGGGGGQPQQTGIEGLRERWSTMSPEEQMQAMFQAVNQNAEQQIAKARTEFQTDYQKRLEGFQQALQQQQAYNQNYQQIWQRAFEMKAKDPRVDVDKIVAASLEALSGKMDPLDLGYKLTMADQNREEFLKDQRALWEKEQEEKRKKEALTPPLLTTTPPAYKAPAQIGPPRALSSRREEVYKGLAEKYGGSILQ